MKYIIQFCCKNNKNKFNAKGEKPFLYKKIWAILLEIVHLHALTKTHAYDTNSENQMSKHQFCPGYTGRIDIGRYI